MLSESTRCELILKCKDLKIILFLEFHNHPWNKDTWGVPKPELGITDLVTLKVA